MAKKPTPAPAPTTRPRLTGNAPPAVQRRRRDPGALRDESRGIPDNDFTITGSKIPGSVALNKPSWQKGSLIFRPVPSFNPDVYNATGKLEHDVYRLSPEPRNFSDFTRKYPGVDYLGDGDDAVSFLLYDYSADEAEYDPASNPYILLYEAVRRAVYRDKTHMQWLPLIDRKANDRPPLKPHCTYYFFQGIVYRRGEKNFFGKDKVPLGLGAKDATQIIRLKNSAGAAVYEALDLRNENWDGPETDYPNSMLHGDPVSLDQGRFITVYNAQAGGMNATVSQELAGLDGSFDLNKEGKNKSRGDDEQGYSIQIDKFFTLNGTVTKMPASYTGLPHSKELIDRIMKRTVWLDDVIRVPSNEEQCLWIAKAMKGYRDVLEFAWVDFPEYMTADVQKVLSASKQASVPGGVPQAGSETTGLLGDLDLGLDFGAAGFSSSEVVDVTDVDTGYAEEYEQAEETEEVADEEVSYEEGEYEADAEEAGDEAGEYEDAEEEVGEEAGEEEEGEYEEESAEEGEYEDAEEGEYEEAAEDDAADEYEDPDDAVVESLEEAVEEEIDEDADAAAALEGLNAARKRSAGRPAVPAEPPKAAKPAPAKPAATKPVATKPVATKPAAAKPGAPKPGVPGKPAGRKPQAK